MDAGAVRGVGGVMGTVWDATEGEGAARCMAEVDEARDEEVAKGRAIRLLGVAVRPPATIPRAVLEAAVGPPAAARLGGGGGAVGPPEAAVEPLAAAGPGSGGGASRPPGAAVGPLAFVGLGDGGLTVRPPGAAVGPPALWRNGNPGGWGWGVGSGVGMGAALQELSCRKMSKSLVRWGETTKGKSDSSKIICCEMMMLLVEIETPIAFVIAEYARKAHLVDRGASL
jgi:hypothetical protein